MGKCNVNNRCNSKISSNWFTYMITRCYGRAYPCFSFNSCCYYGYCWGIFNYKNITNVRKHSFNFTISYFLGALTAFMSGTIGLVQSDLKKVIAYSTCSQLGYMVMICGFSHYYCGLFHLFNHGFFKALLFLSAGSIIHAVNNEQDMRKIGGVKFTLPLSYICIVVGSLSLAGLPFLTGFYSKDLLLELVYQNHFLSF